MCDEDESRRDFDDAEGPQDEVTNSASGRRVVKWNKNGTLRSMSLSDRPDAGPPNADVKVKAK